MKATHCMACPAGDLDDEDKIGLIWVGKQFYSPRSFSEEAERAGVSKRISQKPKWMKLPCWVFVAHNDAIRVTCRGDDGCGGKGWIGKNATDGKKCETCGGEGKISHAGVFFMFRATRFEKVIADTMTLAKREKLQKQGFKLVEVPANDPDHNPMLVKR
jgi:hypothetical protein